ncbi:hypothetical protein PSDT_1169 [Parascardovia denticolens DSM 10105 = JCM 12538]|nr:hypothetical protein PSDT_1169 [Parascardovia denticolens DSM 10105 = JCM 12538]
MPDINLVRVSKARASRRNLIKTNFLSQLKFVRGCNIYAQLFLAQKPKNVRLIAGF